MVDKRRAVERETPVTGGTRANHSEGDRNENIQVQRPRVKKHAGLYTSPQVTVKDSTSTSSSTGGMEDISLTSPSIAESLRPDAMQTPKRDREHQIPKRTLSSALRRLVGKSSTSKGTAHNPIVLDEYSPRRQPIPLPPREVPEYEPHKFEKRHRKLYTYQPERPVLAPKPANGNRFTGDRSSDLYRMINAKGTAVAWTPPVVAATQLPPVTAATQPPLAPHGQVTYGIPFAVQFPRSAQYLMDQLNPIPPYESPYARYHNNMGVTLSGDSEDMLRRKALQHIRDSSRSQLRKKMLSDDPDETSGDDSEQLGRTHIYQDPNDHVSPLVAQTKLLTSLLQCYAKSTDQVGLRQDIALLVGVQKKKVGEWMQAESRRERTSDERVRRAVDQLLAREAEKDHGIRDLLSSNADMWQGGMEGVAEVFGVDRIGRGEKAKRRKLGVCGEDMVR
ncbi:hypothetical protein HBH56_189180 [Parastagonospora nodorum]|uniref:Uncharacterized protein n=2 Tax=Phaeosphaeria nodorum (strain SN15 / ATCC MYA-4574 / FGSC 10173) TaxID=321614 RepID=A0A7U2HY42_PHANO|nr:hypothetical protein SNOG_02441 [Parastagonospora nodorum SN15]KAH3907451.1 hypothetical protein HBH56_189180 [Parastagonospora nodorum]EAT90653.1 hypothetical protein SNOG_02441 [Parastagonospora nodorum SN15]KAH3925157.1 hypothetical protein HBH54_184990 [Parastagonospora nodorum]KAH3963669.1 hypothetical protein HBH51_164180 [Parastagonospora nodorum]KAH4093517.1 hypothetical protein HBH46_176430 [Parastagonospora nodorum]